MIGRGKADRDRYARPKRKSDHASSSSSRRRTAPGEVNIQGPPATPPPTSSTNAITGATTPSPRLPRPPAVIYNRTARDNRRFVGMAVGVRLAIFAVVIAAVVIPLISVGNTVSSINFPTPAPGVSGVGNSSPNPALAAPHRHARPVSYLTAAGVRAGLVVVAKLAPRARLALVRLDARSLSASARLPNGTFKQIVLTPTGHLVTTGASSGERPLPASQISPKAVARIVSGLKSRFHVPASRIDYMVLSTPSNVAAQWVIFSKAPSHPGFLATLAGTHLRQLP